MWWLCLERRDQATHKATDMTAKPPIIDLDREFGRRVVRDTEATLRAAVEDKESAERLSRPGADEFLIDLCRDDDGWKASCITVPYYLEATGPTRAQALPEMARVINRHQHRHQRLRPDKKKADLHELPLPPTSVSADER
jgi:hypothetical protein